MGQFLCIDCVKHIELKTLISTKGKKGVCTLCKKQCDLVVNCNDRELKNLFRTLVRFYYSQWEYDHHFGGEEMSALFEKENPILNPWESLGIENVDDLWNVVDEIISINSDEDKDAVYVFSEPPYLAIKDNYCTKIRKIRDQLESENYFELESDVKDMLGDMLDDVDVVISAGKHYYRARIGYLKRGLSSLEWWSQSKVHYFPYRDNLIGRVPPPLAPNGRMNRQGISFLYLASNSDTALAEVRPYPGQYVSIGKFVSNKSLKIVDFSNVKIGDYCSQNKIQHLITLHTINKLFCTPVPNQNGKEYLITQLLADTIRKLGYDGVKYKSSVGTGTNLTIFDPLAFEYIEDEASVVSVREVRCIYDHCIIMDDSEENYYIIE